MSRSTSTRRPKGLLVPPLPKRFAATFPKPAEALPPAPEPTPPGTLRLGDYVVGEGFYSSLCGHPGIRY